MNKNKTQEIIEEYKSFVLKHTENFNSVLDLGCGYGKFLMLIEDLPFQKFTGIDTEEFDRFSFFHSINVDINKNDISKVHHTKFLDFQRQMVIYFESKFNFIKANVLEYPFEREKYSFINCNNLFHLIPDEQQKILLSKIYSALESNGVAYFKINTKEFINQVDNKLLTFITDRIVEGKEKGKIKRFYLWSERELDILMGDYKWIIKEKTIDGFAIKYIVKKL